MIENSVCFSGHRPLKLPSGGNSNSPDMKELTALIYRHIEKLIDRGYNRFYCGMAEGFDLSCAVVVIALKKKYPTLRLIAVIPFADQQKSFSAKNRALYQKILDFCDEIITLSDKYYRGCYYDRNHFLCDHAEYLLCYCKDAKSGTGETQRYAKKHGLQVLNLYNYYNQIAFE